MTSMAPELSRRRARPRHGWLLACLALACVASATPAHAQSPPGRDKARVCATCHGANGISTLPNAPNLAGQPEIYLVEQLRNYRGGKRQHEVMAVIAKPLSDEDIRDLAAWYAAFGIEVKCPPGVAACAGSGQ